jgi:hypothetical protein
MKYGQAKGALLQSQHFTVLRTQGNESAKYGSSFRFAVPRSVFVMLFSRHVHFFHHVFWFVIRAQQADSLADQLAHSKDPCAG